MEAHPAEGVGHAVMRSFGGVGVPPFLWWYAKVIKYSGTDLLHGRNYRRGS